MLNNRNILCISVPAWKGEYAATIVELMKVLGRTNKVLYVQNPYTVKDVIAAMAARKNFPFAQALGIKSRIREIKNPAGSVYIFTAPILLTINFLPAGFLYQVLLRFNGWLLQRSIAKYLRRLGMEKDLINVVAFNPILGVVTANKFNEKLLMYHCYDEIGEAVWMKKHGAEAERKFIQMADAVVVTSRGLYERKSLQTDRCYLVKNAADIALFSTAFTESIPLNRTVGYIGSLDNRLDYQLLTSLAASMPDVTFRFVGRLVDKVGAESLRALRNVVLEGPRQLEELPALVRTFSAGIIPFVLNKFTQGIYPLKINEYLAAGIPVISTHFSYLDDFSGVITVAEDHNDFRRGLITEMDNDTAEKRRARQTAASENSWDNRAEELSNIITGLENLHP